MNKQQLANKIWASANKMRSKIEANEYKDYILGFIFYKFLSDKVVDYFKKIGLTDEEMEAEIVEENADAVVPAQQDLGYFISYKNLFSTWLSMGKDFTVANVRDALSAFDRLISTNHKKLFDKIFDTLQSGLNKLGTSDAERSGAIRDIVSLIRVIPTDDRQDYDVLGYIYEYLISNFAANAGKKAGEFYTPHEVSVMMSDIIAHHLKDATEIRIYDPTSGSGSLLINIGKSVAQHTQEKDCIKYYAQELKQNTFNLTRMNLIMRGIKPSNIEARNGDTLKDDWPYFDESDPQGTYDPLYVDAVVSNPPYSQEWDNKDQENDPRYAEFGIAPKSCADYAFLLHDLYHVKPDGIMTIVLPHGVLYRGGEEQKIRTALVEHNYIDAIIGLPEKVFFGTGISTIVMVLKRKSRQDDSILFIDASRGYEKEGKNNRLRACDIKKIVDAVTQRSETPDYARLVSRDTIRNNEYNLNISRYVDSSDKTERFDIYATMFGGIPETELASLAAYWQTFPSLRGELFETNEEGYSHLRVKNVAETIAANADVKTFAGKYIKAFADFHEFLEQTLITPMLTLNVPQTESVISDDLFRRLAEFSLVDRYQAFQFFNKDWQQIAIDVEIIQTEGFKAVKEVVPHMVEKNDTEVQDGWEGHVLPFSLVQEELLTEELQHIREQEANLKETTEGFEKIIEKLTPEERDRSILNDDNTKFVTAEVKKEYKRIINSVSNEKIELLRTFPSKKAEKAAFVATHPELPWNVVDTDKNGSYGKGQINKIIRYLQELHTFPEDSYEAKMKQVNELIEQEAQIKKDLTDSRNAIEIHTIETINALTDEAATDLLRTKWTASLTASLAKMPGEVTAALTDNVMRCSAKYATTYRDIAARVATAESRLTTLIDELQGPTADMLGLEAFRKTLKKEA